MKRVELACRPWSCDRSAVRAGRSSRERRHVGVNLNDAETVIPASFGVGRFFFFFFPPLIASFSASFPSASFVLRYVAPFVCPRCVQVCDQ